MVARDGCRGCGHPDFAVVTGLCPSCAAAVRRFLARRRANIDATRRRLARTRAAP